MRLGVTLLGHFFQVGLEPVRTVPKFRKRAIGLQLEDLDYVPASAELPKVTRFVLSARGIGSRDRRTEGTAVRVEPTAREASQPAQVRLQLRFSGHSLPTATATRTNSVFLLRFHPGLQIRGDS